MKDFGLALSVSFRAQDVELMIFFDFYSYKKVLNKASKLTSSNNKIGAVLFFLAWCCFREKYCEDFKM